MAQQSEPRPPTRVDGSACTWLAYCGCGWRGHTTTDRLQARREQYAHAAGEHGYSSAAASRARARGEL